MLKCPREDLLNVLTVSDFTLRAILVLLLVAENVFDFLIKLVTAMAHEQDLEGFFDGNGALE